MGYFWCCSKQFRAAPAAAGSNHFILFIFPNIFFFVRTFIFPRPASKRKVCEKRPFIFGAGRHPPDNGYFVDLFRILLSLSSRKQMCMQEMRAAAMTSSTDPLGRRKKSGIERKRKWTFAFWTELALNTKKSPCSCLDKLNRCLPHSLCRSSLVSVHVLAFLRYLVVNCTFFFPVTLIAKIYSHVVVGHRPNKGNKSTAPFRMEYS